MGRARGAALPLTPGGRLGCPTTDEGRVVDRCHRAPGHSADELLPVRGLYRLDRLSARRSARRRGTAVSPSTGASLAHPKVDDRTGEILFFNYSKEAPYMHYGVVDEADDLVHYVDVPLPGRPRLPHDMAFTENYVVLNDFPLFWEPEASRRARTSHASTATCRAASPSSHGAGRRATSVVRGRPDLVLHFVNAYEDGDAIVLDGFFQGDRSPRTTAWVTGGSGPSASSRSTACSPSAPLAARPAHRPRQGGASPTASPSSA